MKLKTTGAVIAFGLMASPAGQATAQERAARVPQFALD
jgi:hypothetical protein